MVAEKHLSLPALEKSLASLFKTYKKELFDIAIIGSAVKGKQFPEDFDAVLVFRSEVDIEIVRRAKEIGKQVHVSYVTLAEIYHQPLWRTLFIEGYSLETKQKIAKSLGFAGFGLFTYSLKRLGTKKSRFSQALTGYKAEAQLKRSHAELLKPGVVLVPIDFVEDFRSFLETWGVDYTMKIVLA